MGMKQIVQYFEKSELDFAEGGGQKGRNKHMSAFIEKSHLQNIYLVCSAVWEVLELQGCNIDLNRVD